MYFFVNGKNLFTLMGSVTFTLKLKGYYLTLHSGVWI